MINQILTKLIAVGQALEIGNIDHDKTWHIEQAKKQIYEDMLGVIGEDEEEKYTYDSLKAPVRNKLRAKQRIQLREYLDMEDSNE